MFKEQLTEAVKSVIEFERAMKEVAAISRASASQLESLTANANKLGASTEKTAVQIAGLQKELAKLGFTSTEIIAASQSIVDLSTATGENLAGSATVAAATLRAFGLEATEMTRVVDVMAGSFVRSGLDLEKFRESMKLVAPIARATNVDIETTTAALSKLADAGLSGSLAGTALRNLLSNMADPTSKLAARLGYTVETSEDLIKAFKQLRAEGVGLAEAVQMVDVRARPAFFTILNNIDAVEGLSKEYSALTGEGERIAEMMRDTLANDIEIANSAFDAMRREMVEGLTPAMRGLAQDMTTLSEAFRLYMKRRREANDVDKEANENAFTLKNVIKDLIPFYRQYQHLISSAADSVRREGGFERLKEQIDASTNAIEVFKSAASADAMKPVLKSFIELSNKKEKTTEEAKKLAEVSRALRVEFGQDAVAIDKVTGEYFLNTAAIERSIKAKVEEARVTKNTYLARLDDINLTLRLREETDLLSAETGEYTKSVRENIVALYDNMELLREKDLIINTLKHSMSDLVTEGMNGWSVYLDGGKDYLQLLKEIEEAEEKRLKEEEEARKAREKAEAEAKKRRAEELKLIQNKLDLAIAQRKSELGEVQNAIKIANVEDDRAAALRLSNKEYEIRLELLDLVLEKELESIRLSEDTVENKLLREEAAHENSYQQRMNLNTDFVVSLLNNEKKLGDTVAKIGKKSLDDSIKNWKKKQKAQEEDVKKSAVLENQRAMLFTQAIAAMRSTLNTFFDFRKAKRDEELNSINKWEEERVKLAGDNEEAINAIREQADQKRRDIKNKNARDEKVQAMFSIALDTARAVVAALRVSPILAAAVGALGAVQLAMVAAKPVPQFAKGTDNAPEGHAIVGEKGRELVWDKKSGSISVTPDKPTLTYLSKGSVVIPNSEAERMLSAKVDRNEVAYDRINAFGSESKKDSQNLMKLGGMFKDAVREIPLHQTTFDAKGVREFVKKGNNRTERLNRRYGY